MGGDENCVGARRPVYYLMKIVVVLLLYGQYFVDEEIGTYFIQTSLSVLLLFERLNQH